MFSHILCGYWTKQEINNNKVLNNGPWFEDWDFMFSLINSLQITFTLIWKTDSNVYGSLNKKYSRAKTQAEISGTFHKHCNFVRLFNKVESSNYWMFQTWTLKCYFYWLKCWSTGLIYETFPDFIIVSPNCVQLFLCGHTYG